MFDHSGMLNVVSAFSYAVYLEVFVVCIFCAQIINQDFTDHLRT